MGPAGPPADHDASLPADDDPVGDDVMLYRLIPPAWWDGKTGTWEASSGAFDNSSGDDQDMSVLLGDTLAAMGRSPESLVAGRPDWGVAGLRARAVRAEDQEVRRSREADEPAHGDVIGPKSSGRRKRLRKAVEEFVRPTVPVPAEGPIDAIP